MSTDDKLHNLDLLGTFHYVLAGITALFASIWIFYIVIGVVALTGTLPVTNSSGETTDPRLFGWMFIVIGAMIMIPGWCLAVLMFLSGRKMRQRKHRMFSVVVAGIECAFIPLGTVLGVFTLMTLTKPPAKKAYDFSCTGEAAVQNGAGAKVG